MIVKVIGLCLAIAGVLVIAASIVNAYAQKLAWERVTSSARQNRIKEQRLTQCMATLRSQLCYQCPLPQYFHDQYDDPESLGRMGS